MHLDPAWASVTIAACVAAFTGLAWLARRLWHVVSGTTRFLDEYFGTPSHPGVMDRLAEHEKLLHTLIAETRPNGGHSLRDVVHRTARDVADIKDEQARLRAQLELDAPLPPPPPRPRRRPGPPPG